MKIIFKKGKQKERKEKAENRGQRKMENRNTKQKTIYVRTWNREN